jgi:hypothetical protein
MVEWLHEQNPHQLVQLCASLKSTPELAASFDPDALARLLELVAAQDPYLADDVSAAIGASVAKGQRKLMSQRSRKSAHRWLQRVLTASAILAALTFVALLGWTLWISSGPQIPANANAETQKALWQAFWANHPLYARYPFVQPLTGGALLAALGILVLKAFLAWARVLIPLTLWGSFFVWASITGGAFGFLVMCGILWAYASISNSGSSSYTASAHMPRTSGARLASPPGQR